MVWCLHNVIKINVPSSSVLHLDEGLVHILVVQDTALTPVFQVAGARHVGWERKAHIFLFKET